MITYRSTCTQCLDGMIHQTHDDGEQVNQPNVTVDARDPRVRMRRDRRCAVCGCHKRD